MRPFQISGTASASAPDASSSARIQIDATATPRPREAQATTPAAERARTRGSTATISVRPFRRAAQLRSPGVRVIGTVSNEAKAAAARRAGCVEVIDYVNEDFVARVRDLTDVEGVAAVFNSIGRDTFLKSLEVLRPRGVLAAFGQASGSPPAFDPFLLAPKALHVTWPGRHVYTASRQQLETSAADLFDAIREGILTSVRAALMRSTTSRRRIEISTAAKLSEPR